MSDNSQHLEAIRSISGMYAYVNLLLDGDPESEDPKKILKFFGEQFKQILKNDHNCQEYGCPVCDPESVNNE